MKGTFLSDIQDLRRRAREHVERGAVTDAYKADRETVVRVLNEALATEIVCVLRYKRHHFMATGIHSQAVAAEFAEHATEEQEHADWIAGRITQLGGEPDFNPEILAKRSHAEYVEGDTLVEMIREDLVAERIAIESYSEMIAYVRDTDPVTRMLLERILEKEQEHADDLRDLLSTLDPRQTERPTLLGTDHGTVPPAHGTKGSVPNGTVAQGTAAPAPAPAPATTTASGSQAGKPSRNGS